jgi:cell fate regulator YaaT (PSP1 superfamily)
MKVVQIQFTPWDKIYNFDPGDSFLLIGDYVVVKTELGVEIGKVIGFKDLPACPAGKPAGRQADREESSAGEESEIKEIKPILRKATTVDMEKMPDEKQKMKTIEDCRKIIVKYNLSMKLVDAHHSFDGSRITFAFIADGRVDFRELVKDLTRHFSRTIRLQQIGIRDEAKLMGDFGHCGCSLCCKRFLPGLSSITSEMAEIQQIAHRGSERLSGICGRLMCCLAYEQNGYKCSAEKLPPIGAKVNVDGKRGIVVGHHILKQSVDVEFAPENGSDGRTVVEVDLNRKKK